MPTQEELDAQNNSFQAQQPYVNPFMQPDVNPFMQPYNIGSIQPQGYSNNYDDEGMTEGEWAAYLAGLEESQAPQATYNPPAPTAPQSEMSPMVRAMLEDRLARTNADIVASGGTVPSLGAATPEAFSPLGGGFSFGGDIPIPADRENGFIPEKEGFLTGGTPVFSNQGRAPAPEAIPAVEMATPESIAKPSVNGAGQVAPRAVAPRAVAPRVVAPQGLTTAGGQPLAEFLAGGLRLDAQGRMIDPDVDRSSFERESMAREARQAARPDFGKSYESIDDDRITRDGDTGDGAPTALFKKEAEAAGLSGRAKAEFVSERSRAWNEAREDREIAKSSGRAAAGRAATELGIKVSEEGRKLTEAEKKSGIELSSAAGALNALKADLDLIRGKGEEISSLSQKSLTEGLLGKAISKLSPTSSAAQLERASGVLTGDAFIKGMQVIKEFGGGLGSVTEVEGLKVERAQGAIFEPGMSGAERRAAVNNYIEVRENAYNRIHSQFVKQYGEEAAANYLGDSSGNVGQAGQTGKRYPDDQDHGAAVDTYFQGN